MSRKLDQTTAICRIARCAGLLRYERLFHCLTKRYVDYIAKIYDMTKEESIAFALKAYFGGYGFDIKAWTGIDNLHGYKYDAAYNRLKARMFLKDDYRGAELKSNVIMDIISNNCSPSCVINNLDDFFEGYEILLKTEKDLVERTRILYEITHKSDMEFFRTLMGYKLGPTDLLIYLHLCSLYRKCEKTVNIVSLSDDHIIEKPLVSLYRLKKSFAKGLIEHGMNGGFLDMETLSLSRKGRQILECRQVNDKSVMNHADLKECRLYFNDNLERQIDEVCALVVDESYRNICERLRECNMRVSLCVLFYGEPGTGKTESVLQIAKRTGRNIIKVDMSKLKDCYVGESEKNVKEVFDNYREVANNSDTTPILLLNEADAIIGKRLENTSNSVDKMENAIQNIILDEMENFEGIMFATTNFIQNFDAAFERRFLYKVKFERPTADVRCKVFENKIPYLPHDMLQTLSVRYDFSGGQIENVSRKCEINRILYGNDSLTMDKVDEICREEIFGKKHGRIGF